MVLVTNFIAAPDVNGDGIPDLASASAVYVLLGKDDGTFSSPAFTLRGTSPAVAFGGFEAIRGAIERLPGRFPGLGPLELLRCPALI